MTEEVTKTGYGRLYGIGVGPGDPELLTLKAHRILQQVPLVCVPQATTSSDSFALGIVGKFLNLDVQEVMRIRFPTNNEKGAGEVWRRAACQIAGKLKGGQDAAFITEGDPMLYSTFSYVLKNIRADYPGVPVEIVPGVPSVMAAAASAEAPLVTHGQSLAVLPAAYGVSGLREAIASHDTVVLMKVNRAMVQALTELEKLGLTGKSVYVKRATTDSEQVVYDLKQLAEEDLDYFSLLITRKCLQ